MPFGTETSYGLGDRAYDFAPQLLHSPLSSNYRRLSARHLYILRRLPHRFASATVCVGPSIVRATSVRRSAEYWELEPGTTYTSEQHQAAEVRRSTTNLVARLPEASLRTVPLGSGHPLSTDLGTYV